MGTSWAALRIQAVHLMSFFLFFNICAVVTAIFQALESNCCRFMSLVHACQYHLSPRVTSQTKLSASMDFPAPLSSF